MESQTLSHGLWQRIPYLQTLMFSKSMEHISSKFSLPSLHKTKSFLLFFFWSLIHKTHIKCSPAPWRDFEHSWDWGRGGLSLAVFARRAQVSETQRHWGSDGQGETDGQSWLASKPRSHSPFSTLHPFPWDVVRAEIPLPALGRVMACLRQPWQPHPSMWVFLAPVLVKETCVCVCVYKTDPHFCTL